MSAGPKFHRLRVRAVAGLLQHAQVAHHDVGDGGPAAGWSSPSPPSPPPSTFGTDSSNIAANAAGRFAASVTSIGAGVSPPLGPRGGIEARPGPAQQFRGAAVRPRPWTRRSSPARRRRTAAAASGKFFRRTSVSPLSASRSWRSYWSGGVALQRQHGGDLPQDLRVVGVLERRVDPVGGGNLLGRLRRGKGQRREEQAARIQQESRYVMAYPLFRNLRPGDAGPAGRPHLLGTFAAPAPAGAIPPRACRRCVVGVSIFCAWLPTASPSSATLSKALPCPRRATRPGSRAMGTSFFRSPMVRLRSCMSRVVSRACGPTGRASAFPAGGRVPDGGRSAAASLADTSMSFTSADHVLHRVVHQLVRRARPGLPPSSPTPASAPVAASSSIRRSPICFSASTIGGSDFETGPT